MEAESVDPAELSSNSNKLSEEIVVLNLTGYEGLERETIVISRTQKQFEEAVADIRKVTLDASQFCVTNSSPVSPLESRINIISLEGANDFRDGVYLLFRMQETTNNDSVNAVPDTTHPNSIHTNSEEQQVDPNVGEAAVNVQLLNDSSATSNDQLPSTSSVTNSSSKSGFLKFTTFIYLLESLKSPFSFAEIKAHLLTKQITVNSRRLNSLLYRAVNSNILVKYRGRRVYKLKR